MKDLAGRKCLVTGAASGIGRATAITVAAKGGELFLTDVNAQELEATGQRIRDAGGSVAYSKPLDISDHASVVAMADEITAAHGSLDVLMNIAGISRWGSVENLSHEDWERLIAINLMGPIHVIETLVPPMIEAGRGGHLVNVSSAAGLFGLPWHAAYSASKFGLRGISEVLRFDLRRHGIGVSLVCPGGVDTPLVGTVQIAGVDRDSPSIQKMVKRFQRHAQPPEHVADCIVRGVERNRYMVFTSNDIRVGYWFQRKFSPPYTLAMRLANKQMNAVARRSRSRG